MVLSKCIISADGVNKIGAIFPHMTEILLAGKLTTSNVFELSRLKNRQEIPAAFQICSQKKLKHLQNWSVKHLSSQKSIRCP